MKTLYVLGASIYSLPFRKLGYKVIELPRGDMPDEVLKEMYPAPDLILFTGGEDISYGLYADRVPSLEKEERRLYYDTKIRQRCQWEVEWWNWATTNKIKMFGTCRGMQFFTAMTGGWIIEHVDGHFGGHKIITYDREEFVVNSIHHQMCVPATGSAELLAYSAKRIIHSSQIPSMYPQELTNKDGAFIEPEALWFPKYNALGVQWHPEGMHDLSHASKWLAKQVEKYLHD